MRAPIFILFFIINTYCFAQEEQIKVKHHRISLALGHAHIPSGINIDGKKTWLALPSWGFDYDYSLNKKWGIGIHTDLIIENFKVYKNDGVLIERTKPIASALVVTRKIGSHITFLAGGGAEFAEEGTIPLIRFGIDYGVELAKNWEASASLMSDIKIQSYNSWVLGLGIAKFL